MDEPVYKCEVCGRHVLAGLADLYTLAGERHAFCSPDHRIEWIELNQAVIAQRHGAEPGRNAPPDRGSAPTPDHPKPTES